MIETIFGNVLDKFRQKKSSKNAVVNYNEYKKKVEKAAKENSPEVITNGTAEHTNVLLSNTLSQGRESVLIYDRDISGDLLEKEGDIDLFNDFKKFLDGDSKRTIQIIIDPGEKVKEELISKLKNLVKDEKRIQIFKLNAEALSEKNQDLNDIPYFFVGDEEKYRIEPKTRFTQSRKAFASMHNEILGKSLTRLFNNLRKVSEPI